MAQLKPEIFADIYQYGKKLPTKISLQEAWGCAGHDGAAPFTPFPDYLTAALPWMTASRNPIDDTHIRAHDSWWNEFRQDPYGGEMGAKMAIWLAQRLQACSLETK